MRVLCTALDSVKQAFGGGDQDRTDDLLIANQTLSQLSYTPTAGAS